MKQCKDIPDLPILKFLEYLNGRWANWFYGDYDNTVQVAFPEWARNTKLVLAKMKMLIRRGLVDGCDCGCMGDFVLTPKGKDFILKKK